MLAGLALMALPQLNPPASASPRVSGKVVAREVRHTSPAQRGGTLERLGGGAPASPTSGQTGDETLAYTSPVIDARQRFDYVGVHWQAARGAEESLFVEVRTSADGTSWSEWEARFEEEDMRDLDRNEIYAAPLRVGDARYAQYRVWFTNGDPKAARTLSLTFMDVSDLNASPVTRLANDLVGAWRDFERSFAAHAATGAPRVHTRADWAADESIMDWIPEYKPWQKAVVHHTVTTNNYSEAQADDEIRAIYHYHAITRGWTDIGYNFIVDRFGKIWQGRQGGDDTAGGHAFGWNHGSFGVAALGDFSVAQPSFLMEQGIGHIIASEFMQRGISVYGSDFFVHKEKDANDEWVEVGGNPPNIQGHRECPYEIAKRHLGGQTACPGAALYNRLSATNGIKAIAANVVAAGYAPFVHFTTSLPHVAATGKTLSVPVTVKNVGRSTIPSGTRLSYRLLSATTGLEVLAMGPVTALGDIAPGAAQTVTATVNVPTSPGRYLVRWDLHTSGVGWFSTVHGTQVRDEWLDARDWDVAWVADSTPATMVVGRTASATVTVKNTGGKAWPAANVKLAFHWFDPVSGSVVLWDGDRSALPSDVQPDQQVTVNATVRAPGAIGALVLEYDLVYEGQFWFSSRGASTLEKPVNVPFDFKATYGAVSPLSFVTDEQKTVGLTVTNTGSATWPAGPSGPVVNVGTHWYTAAGALVQWDGLRTALPQDVAPGQSVVVQAKAKAPRTNGSYQVQFDLVLEGVGWFSDRGSTPRTVAATVREPGYGAQYAAGPIGTVAATTVASVPVTLTNTGDFTWTSPEFALGYHVYDASGRLVLWDGVRTALPQAVAPGASVAVQALFRAPATNGTYTVRWDMVREGIAWFSAKGVLTAADTATVVGPTYGATYDTTQSATTLPTRLATVWVRVRNNSNFPFNAANAVSVSYHWYDAAGRLIHWDGLRTAIDIAPNQIADVAVRVQPPTTPGTYRVAFDLVRDGVAWFSSKGVPAAMLTVSVTDPAYFAQYAPPQQHSAPRDQTATVPVTITNTGSLTWSETQYFLAYHLYRNGVLYVWDGLRTALPGPVAPGQSVTVNASVKLPLTPGTYSAQFDLVHEGATWFSGRGVPTGAMQLISQ